jgi:hypothetical protein
MTTEPITSPPVQEVIPGARILDEARAYVKRFVVFPDEAHYTAVTLWAAATHAHMSFATFPRLAFLAPEPASGKTRALEITLQLCARPRMELDPTGPAVANVIALDHPTLGIDETDTIFGKAGSSSAKQQLRSILNSGYKAGATMTRKQGASYISTPVFGPVVFAGLGQLPDTLMTRSVVVRMRRRQSHERTEPYFSRMHAPLGAAYGENLAQWASTVSGQLAEAWPDLPEGVEDRAYEVWAPLVALADVAGDHWPETARAACRAIALDTADAAGPTPADRLLADLREVWPPGQPNAGSAALRDALRALPAAPWRTLLGDDVAALRTMSAMLAVHGVSVAKVKDAGRAVQGYRRSDLAPLWSAVPEVPELAREGE